MGFTPTIKGNSHSFNLVYLYIYSSGLTYPPGAKSKGKTPKNDKLKRGRAQRSQNVAKSTKPVAEVSDEEDSSDGEESARNGISCDPKTVEKPEKAKRYSLDELLANEDLFKSLIDRKKEDLQNQLSERRWKSSNKSTRGNEVEIDQNFENLNSNNRVMVQPISYPEGVNRFKGGYCVESPSNTTIYASVGKILEERCKIPNGNQN